jgi:hypothetical protein
MKKRRTDYSADHYTLIPKSESGQNPPSARTPADFT